MEWERRFAHEVRQPYVSVKLSNDWRCASGAAAQPPVSAAASPVMARAQREIIIIYFLQLMKIRPATAKLAQN